MMGWLTRLVEWWRQRPSRKRSPQWASVRRSFLLVHRDCQACGSARQLEAHHVRPYHLYPELELEWSNLLCLCRRCHLVFGHLGSWSAWNPTARQDASYYRLQVMHRPTERK